MTRVEAYAFRSALNLAEIRARLNALGPWRWIDRDSDRLGEYLSTRALPSPDRGMVKIFVEGERYIVNLVIESTPENVEAVFSTVLDRLLPALGATDLTATETIE